MRIFEIILLLATVVAFAGCGGSVVDTRAILHTGNGAEVQNLDPHLVTGDGEHRVLSSLFEGLADLDPETMKPVPAAAESWTVSDDGLQYTFTIRENAKWSDGAPLTADDFVYAWHRILSPNLAAPYVYMLFCIKNAKAFNEGRITDFAEVGAKAPDPRTLVVSLASPTPYLLLMQTHQSWYPMQRAAIEKYGTMDERDTPWTLPGRLVGNGPFALDAWNPNEMLRVLRNPYYWDSGKVRLDGIEFYPIDNLQTEERCFRAGELHLTYTVPLRKVRYYREKYPELLHIEPYCGVYFYRFNTTKPPFDDKRVRRAFAMAINRKELVENVMKGGELPAQSLTPPNTAGYTPRAGIPYDVEAAKALLAEAGHPGGEGLPPIEILFNTSEAHRTIAETIQNQWKEALGVETLLLNQDWKVYLASVDNFDYAVSRGSWIADFLDPINFLEMFLTNGGNNRTGWSNPKYDALLAKSYTETDQNVRYELLQQAEAILDEEAPIAPIYIYTQKYLMAPELKGLVSNPIGYIRWRDLWLEKP